MAGVEQDKDKLLKLQELDNILQDGAENFNNSEIGKKIAAVRMKKSELKTKRDQVDQVFVKARTEIETVSNKDSQLAAEQEKAQKEIESTQGDYRKVEAETQKLNELNNQRKTIDDQLEKLEANFNKIKELKEKIDAGIEKLGMQEDDLSVALEKSNVELKLKMDKAMQEKAKLEPTISSEALAIYKKSRSIAGKITVAVNEDNMCSACRTKFSSSNISKIESQAPIAVCPNCLRVLI